MRSIFITGHDTNCGKTYAMCQLLAYFKKTGQRAMGLKPIASGCYQDQDGQWVNEDEVQIQYHNPPNSSVTRWKFIEPIAPHIAAARAGQVISINDLAEFCSSAHPAYKNLDYLLIEGAGGLMVPLNECETWIDFLKLTGIPAILVVGMRLGCLNHALLTAAAMQQHGIACLGWIANALDPNMLALEGNMVTLENWLDFPLLGKMDYEGELVLSTTQFESD